MNKTKKVKLPVQWIMSGEIEIEVEVSENDSIMDTCRKAIGVFYNDYNNIERPEGEYMEDSFSLSVDKSESDVKYLEFYNK